MSLQSTYSTLAKAVLACTSLLGLNSTFKQASTSWNLRQFYTHGSSCALPQQGAVRAELLFVFRRADDDQPFQCQRASSPCGPRRLRGPAHPACNCPAWRPDECPEFCSPVPAPTSSSIRPAASNATADATWTASSAIRWSVRQLEPSSIRPATHCNGTAAAVRHQRLLQLQPSCMVEGDAPCIQMELHVR